MSRDNSFQPFNPVSGEDLAQAYFTHAAVAMAAENQLNKLNFDEQNLREKLLPIDGTHFHNQKRMLAEEQARAEETAKPRGVEKIFVKFFTAMTIPNAEYMIGHLTRRIERNRDAEQKVATIKKYLAKAEPNYDRAVTDGLEAADSLRSAGADPDGIEQQRYIRVREQVLNAQQGMENVHDTLMNVMRNSDGRSVLIAQMEARLAAKRPPIVKQSLRSLWAEAATDRLLLDLYSPSPNPSWETENGDTTLMKLQISQQRSLTAFGQAFKEDIATQMQQGQLGRDQGPGLEI